MIRSAICAIARNEEDYLSEWLTYHLNLGFDHIFLYDNNNSKDNNLYHLCIEQSWKDQVTIVDYRGRTAAQLVAYNECYTNIRKDFDWVAFIDVDEFITFGPECLYKNINQYLENVENFNVIFINWMYYGDNEKVYFEKEDVIKRFPLPAQNSKENLHVKSIIKTTADIQFKRTPHCPDGQTHICDDCQKELLQSEPFKQPSFEKLYIRHYGTKTIEEFIENKMLRGAADQNINPYKLDLFYRTNKRTKAKREVEKKHFHISTPQEHIPLVSVIIPNYNHKKYLKQRIDSVLAQTFTDFELILLDDCSNDNSQQFLLSYKDNPHVSYISINTVNGGSPFTQWEKGIRLAKGKYIWIAESDDSAKPDFLATTVKQLEAHPEARLCTTGSFIIDAESKVIPSDEFDKWQEDGKAYQFNSTDYLKTHMFLANSVYNAGIVLFRREDCLSDINHHYRSMRYCGDWLFWIEQIKKGKIIEVHKKLNCFRKHKDCTTNEGILDGKALVEIAYIRSYLYKNTIKDWKIILKDKHDFYRIVKYFPISSTSKRRKIFRAVAKEGNITYWHYLLWKLYKIYLKKTKRNL